ncbi:hypothetical protein BGZ92_001889 [Podila epicladia]|nr:hypothetical protein BGZ92_001889 [Podila epicladia]
MLDHMKKPLCPTFRKYDRQKLILLEPNDCTPLDSKHPDFSAACTAANQMYPISLNATHEAFHRQFSGPDSFHVVFSGSEKLSPPDWYHAGQCLYVFPFHISNPGKLSLDITHLYDNFGGVVEQTEEWPVLRNQKVVSSVPLEVCRGCQTRIAPPRFPIHDGLRRTERREHAGFIVRSASNLRNRYESFNLENAVMIPDPDLPLCSRELAVQGAWLPAHPLDRQSWRQSNYTWTPLGCKYDKPLDASCLQRKKSAKKILFQGDTHLREAMGNLLSRLNGTQALQTLERLEEKIAETTLAYLHDPLFAHAGERSDMIVANMGHWATGTKFLDQQWSTSKYHDKLRDLVEMIQQRARDLQDLDDEDEDFDSTHRFVDGEYSSGYYYDEEEDDGHSEDDDEFELEQAREQMRQRQQNAKENEVDLEISWSDETEEEKMEPRPLPSSQPSRPYEDDSDEDRDYEGRHRDGGRYREEEDRYDVGRSRYGNNDSNDRRTPNRPRLRFPDGRMFRQSKHLKEHLPVDDKSDQSIRSSSSSPSSDRMDPLREGSEKMTEKSAHGGYRYGAQKKVVDSGNSKLTNALEELLDEPLRSSRDSKKEQAEALDHAAHHQWTNSDKDENRSRYISSGENSQSGTKDSNMDRNGDRKGSVDSKSEETSSKGGESDRPRASGYTNFHKGAQELHGIRTYEQTDYRMARRLIQRRDAKTGVSTVTSSSKRGCSK